MSKFVYTRNLFISSISALLLAACGAADGSSPAQKPVSPAISVAQVVSERITEWDEYTGRLQAPESVTLQPRVSGYVESIRFREGALVKQGQILFKVDDRSFVAEVERLQAEKLRAESTVLLAKGEFERGKKLVQQNAISTELQDNRATRYQQAQAELSAINASLKMAQLQLSYTEVTSPVDGKISIARVTKGNYVTAGQTVLTTIVSTNQMYAYFDVDEQTYLRYSRLHLIGDQSAQKSTPIFMALAGEEDFSFQGNIDFVNNRVNETTGSIRLRATFANHDNRLVPGLFARLKMSGSAPYEGILIDDKAIATDLNRQFVLKLNDENRLEYQPITLGEKILGLRIIKSGLTASDKIVINGLHKVRNNMEITPKEVPMATQEQLAMLKKTQKAFDDNNMLLSANTQLID